MKIYKDIYGFQAMDEIRKEKDVYVIDKEDREVYCMNTMRVADFINIVNSDNDNDRFSFYIIEETNE
jgi:hypothetical protein